MPSFGASMAEQRDSIAAELSRREVEHKLLERNRELEAALKDAVAEIHTLVQKLAAQGADE